MKEPEKTDPNKKERSIEKEEGGTCKKFTDKKPADPCFSPEEPEHKKKKKFLRKSYEKS